jgi:hypothetical protein
MTAAHLTNHRRNVMHENDHANNGNANSPDAHQDPNRDGRPQENPPGRERRKPGGPDFPLQSDPKEPDKPSSGS